MAVVAFKAKIKDLSMGGAGVPKGNGRLFAGLSLSLKGKLHRATEGPWVVRCALVAVCR
jgi:hypothetical protein